MLVVIAYKRSGKGYDSMWQVIDKTTAKVLSDGHTTRQKAATAMKILGENRNGSKAESKQDVPIDSAVLPGDSNG
jgi:hypothetical protein